MITVVCDTNIYVSAIVFGGPPRDVIALGADRKIQLLVSPALISEVERVLERKFGWDPHRVRRICRPLWKIARLLESTTEVTVCRDPKDNHLLALAIDGPARFLNIGDSDLLVLSPFHNIRILSPARFLEEEPRATHDTA